LGLLELFEIGGDEIAIHLRKIEVKAFLGCELLQMIKVLEGAEKIDERNFAVVVIWRR